MDLLLEKNHIRFDEKIRIYEDASFISEAAIHAQKTCSLFENLYNYSVNPNGISATKTNTVVHWRYKFEVLEERKRISACGSAEVGGYCRASHVFSALEMLTLWKKAGLTLREFKQGMAKYLRDPIVSEALENFPLALRHPLAASAVMALRLWRAIL